MRRHASVRFAITVAWTLSLSGTAFAQQNTSTAAVPQGAAKTHPGTKKILGLSDIGRWNRINSATLSSDGKWMTYVYQPNDGDPTLYIRQLDGEKTHTIAVGSAPVFSDDAHFVGYYVSPPERAGRGGRAGGGGRAAQPGTPTPPTPGRRFELLDLTTGDKYSV